MNREKFNLFIEEWGETILLLSISIILGFGIIGLMYYIAKFYGVWGL